MNWKNVILAIIMVLLLGVIGAEVGVFFKDKNVVEQTRKEAVDRKVSAMEFVLYNDDSGVVLDSEGKRLGGFTLSGGRSGMMIFHFASSMDFFGKETEKVYLKEGYAYANFEDELNSNVSNGIAYEKKDEGSEVHFLFKSGKTVKTSTSKTNTDRTSKSYWKINSVSELKKKIAGTIWTCRPSGNVWYRLVFKGNRMTLYFAEPSSGKWMGGGDDQVWSYSIEPTYNSYDGEKNISVQFRKPDNPNLSFGAMFFNKDGTVDFQWLRGKYGGLAECKDYKWE